ncbi:hypothetical protein [Haloarchaeobius sp. DYHT-AS-18]|uniref:hypothetical protein n=1 Tax=Haloarchaeobius sp. DYHT-AS-18 TaxID=3446117 RepID=UPI003EBE47EF
MTIYLKERPLRGSNFSVGEKPRPSGTVPIEGEVVFQIVGEDEMITFTIFTHESDETDE